MKSFLLITVLITMVFSAGRTDSLHAYKAAKIGRLYVDSNTTANTIPYLNANKQIVSSITSYTQLGFLDLTDSIQKQLNSKLTGTVTATVVPVSTGSNTYGNSLIQSGTSVVINPSNTTSNYDDGIRIQRSPIGVSMLALGAISGWNGTGRGQWTMVTTPLTDSHYYGMIYNATMLHTFDTLGNVRLGPVVTPTQTATPTVLTLDNSYSNGVTNDKCKIYLHNDGSGGRYGFGIGNSGDIQYHSQSVHDLYIDNVKKLSISSSTANLTNRLVVHNENAGTNYYEGNLELRTTQPTYPLIGFHRSGWDAMSLVYTGGMNLAVRNNDDPTLYSVWTAANLTGLQTGHNHGTGTVNTLQKATTTTGANGDSRISDDGSMVTVTGPLGIGNGDNLVISNTDKYCNCGVLVPTISTSGAYPWFLMENPHIAFSKRNTVNQYGMAGLRMITDTLGSSWYEAGVTSTIAEPFADYYHIARWNGSTSVDLLHIDSVGNVGIGKIPTAGTRLDVAGLAFADSIRSDSIYLPSGNVKTLIDAKLNITDTSAFLRDADTIRLYANANATSLLRISDTATTLRTSIGTHNHGTGTVNTLQKATNTTGTNGDSHISDDESLVTVTGPLATTGNVAAGTGLTGPTRTPTKISTGLNHSDTTSSIAMKFALYDDANTQRYGFSVGATSDVQYFSGYASGASHDFYINDIRKVRINSTGLGIGKTPTAPLDVAGLALADSIRSDSIYLPSGNVKTLIDAKQPLLNLGAITTSTDFNIYQTTGNYTVNYDFNGTYVNAPTSFGFFGGMLSVETNGARTTQTYYYSNVGPTGSETRSRMNSSWSDWEVISFASHNHVTGYLAADSATIPILKGSVIARGQVDIYGKLAVVDSAFFEGQVDVYGTVHCDRVNANNLTAVDSVKGNTGTFSGRLHSDSATIPILTGDVITRGTVNGLAPAEFAKISAFGSGINILHTLNVTGTPESEQGGAINASDGAIVGKTMRTIQESWNATPFRIGSYYFWIDTNGKLRIKNGAPTSDEDGESVGSQ